MQLFCTFSLIFYNTSIQLLRIGIGFASLFNTKAKAWINGRKNIFTTIKKNNNPNTLWMHCASVGEYEQGLPVLQKYKKENINSTVILTFFSPSGYNAFKKNDAVDEVYYLPLDTKKNAQKFVELINPSIVIFIKYEFWYHYLHTLYTKKIATFLVSGIFRNNSIFTKKYGNIHRKMLVFFTYFFVQNKQSKNILNQLGFTNVCISGDTRFDRVLEISKLSFTDKKIEQFCANKKTIIAGSTWTKDEDLLVNVFNEIKEEYNLIIVPHEIQNNNILKLKNKFNNTAFLYTDDENTDDKNVMIINKMGMLSKLYRFGNIAYIGGGFGSGIHNILEPAVYGLPIIFGPKCTKFQEAKDLQDLHVAKSITNSTDFVNAIHAFSKNIQDVQKTIHLHFNNKKGATNLILSKLKELN